MKAVSPVSPEAVEFGEKHVLFVEGSSKPGLDYRVVEALFGGRLNVKPLGMADNLKNVAKAMREYHPDYYFVIDRDHRSEEEVEKSCNYSGTWSY